MRLPFSVEFIKKDQWVIVAKSSKKKRKVSVTINALFRKILIDFNGDAHQYLS
jgi:hypothetical protein